MLSLEPGKYIHTKSGRMYNLLYEGRHSETSEMMVVYQACYGDREIWVRPRQMWSELVNGKPRFQKLRPSGIWGRLSERIRQLRG